MGERPRAAGHGAATRTRRSAVNEKAGYAKLVRAFRAFVEQTVPEGATVAVVSKGDHELLVFDERSGWHFPQRTDGVYAGYYPADSASAIAHLEGVRAKGAEFIAFPAASLWWLEKYEDFGRHVQTRFSEVARDEDVGAIFALSDAARPATRRRSNGTTRKRKAAESVRERAGAPPVAPPTPKPPPRTGRGARDVFDAELLQELRALFDATYYGEQCEMDFESPDEAFEHYVAAGVEAADPHALFDSRWYLRRHPEVRLSGECPLAHFVRHGCVEQLNPGPYFDTAHYYEQMPHLREEGRNALLHYLATAPEHSSAHPNALFHDSYYRASYGFTDTDGPTPFEHFVRFGRLEGRFGSPLHRNMLKPAARPSSSLLRGDWRRGTVLFVTSGAPRPGGHGLADIGEELGRAHHTGSLVVGYRGQPDDAAPAIVLEDYELAAEIFRPASLRLLALSLAALGPKFAVCDVPEPVEALKASNIPTLYVLPEAADMPPAAELAAAVESADRVLVPSSAAFRAAAELLGRHPTNVTLTPPASVTEETAALVELAQADLGFVPESQTAAVAAQAVRPKVVIPCSDWAVSGVNASLESVGQRLIELGWDVEVLFTRKPESVLASIDDDAYLPALPYRFLDRHKPGVMGMWEDLIAELESTAPTILFMAYDFYANGAAAALTDRVGVVAWAQADDGDYYEQAYRLGRYCNAVVCVSERIKDGVSAMNPVIGERAHVIHNSSVRERDIAKRRPPKGTVMRLAYSGRLVEYQKRVLDFLDLTEALDRTGVPYELSLIGTFSPRDKAEDVFRRAAKEHLEDGRIKLRGRMTRPAILEELTSHDFFMLLSDFEGLPLSLVEAMARGCVPVVAESPSGIPELIDDGVNGLIVSGRDYDEWASLLVETWRDGRRHALMSRRARAKVRERFSVEQVGQQLSDLFDRVGEEITDGTYQRPPSLNWGPSRSHTGDILPPPSMHDPGGFTWV
jgi:glycosyltransferase involved in cell wall biosynthesis